MQSVVLRNGVEIEDPAAVVLGFLEAGWVDRGGPSTTAPFGEHDLRSANRGGARISAAEIAAILEHRRTIDRALRAIDVDASLTGANASVPWAALEQLFAGFADIRGVGFAKMTKTLHPRRPALIPMLDSVVQKYLADDDPGVGTPFAVRGLALVRGYKRDLDRHRSALRVIRREAARRGHELSDVRVLDLLIWSIGGGVASAS